MATINRKSFMSRLGLAATALFLPNKLFSEAMTDDQNKPATVKRVFELGFQWDTLDPFLFCVHHEDFFPKGNDQLGPTTSMAGRIMGDDFIVKDGFRMYHGKVVPGFPGHPHRGFETVTVVRKGLVDHADSMGASGRYGNGDVQWMTAGSGVQHSEMFPLLNKDAENPLELFQIWMNLPKRNKMVDPHFKMLWREDIPAITHKDANGKQSLVELIAGSFDGKTAVTPPPNSWAADSANEVLMLNIRMSAGASIALPIASAGVNRMIYFYEGDNLQLCDTTLPKYHAAEVHANHACTITASSTGANILILQGKPIGEPVMQYGPFVMNTKEEINQTFEDYHKTQFGGWPWSRYDQVYDAKLGRFAKHADGTEEVKG
jgi:quercetin 2,3-dioxygenase